MSLRRIVNAGTEDMMTKNMGTLDRRARVALALFLLIAALFADLGALQWVAIAVAAVFTLTSVVGNCPLYNLLGFKTCSEC
jgi:hypothetical protein